MSEVLIKSVQYFFMFLEIVLFLRILLSWIPMASNPRANPILALVYAITDPILNPLRRMMQKSPLGGRGMAIDFSPIFAFFLLSLAERFILYLIFMFVQ